MKVSADIEDWKKIIYCGLENQQLDFKAHQNWNDIGRVGRAKFARHAMAMANTQGGYVVVGVGEDQSGNPNQYVGMTEAEASSFDPSCIGQTVNRYADPPVALDVAKPVVDGRQYVVLVIYPFTDIPHVCTECCEHELQRGVFYVRSVDARSKVAAQASELHTLVRRALRNQRQSLGRMLRGILYEDRMNDISEYSLVPALLERSRVHAQEHLGRSNLHGLPYFELSCYPGQLFSDVDLTRIREALPQVELPSEGDIADRAAAREESSYFATNESLCGVITYGGLSQVIWEAYTNGLLYLAVLLPQESKRIDGTVLARYILYSLMLIGQYYTNLRREDKLLNIEMRIPNAENCSLVHLPAGVDSQNNVSRIPELEVKCQRSAADLEGGANIESAVLCFVAFCERFNIAFDGAAREELTLAMERTF